MSESSLKRPSAFLPAAGWVPWPGRSQVRLTGADRAKFLHNFCTNDIKKLQPGQGCEAFLTSIKGRILGHLFVFAGENDLVIDTVPGEDVKIRDHLDRYLITEDVQIEVVTDQFRCAYLFGADWPQLLMHGLGIDLGGLAPYEHLSLDKFDLKIRRFDLGAIIGFEVAVPAGAVDDVGLAFRFQDNATPPQRVELEQFEALRIDAGFPIYGVDLTEDHLAQEAARTEKAISFNKGCYLGQEPIARIDALGHVNRQLRVVAFEQPAELSVPAKVLDAASRAEVGQLTSFSQVPGSAGVGLGMLRTSAQIGSDVIAVGTQGESRGRVVEPAAG